MAQVHPTAVIDAAVQLDDSVEIGPFCVLEGEVAIGADTRLGPGCMVQGPTTIGTGNALLGSCSIGGPSQDKKFKGGGWLRIGDGNMFREYCTVNRSSDADGATVVGDDNWLMAYSHVAHDCELGSSIVLANATQLAGHVVIADGAIAGGGTLVHQFCRIGRLAIIGGGTVVRQDVPPYANHTVSRGRVVVDINRIGMQRAGLGDSVDAVKKAYRLLYSQGLDMQAAAARIDQLAAADPVLEPLARFVAADSRYGLVRPRSNAGADGAG